MMMSDTCWFKSDDHNWKPTETIIRNLCGIASKGGKYPLSVGQITEGLIPEACVTYRRQFGGNRPDSM